MDRQREIERKGWNQIRPHLVERYENVHRFDGGIEFQAKRGDFSAIDKILRRKVWCECKHEQANLYGNLFLETWSNRREKRPGWMITSEADRLIYHFINDVAFDIDFARLREWYEKNKNFFPVKQQKKTRQENDTWGACVGIEVIRTHVGFDHEWSFHPAAEESKLPIIPAEKRDFVQKQFFQ